jgi:AAA+ ATPase superfamily predicted ATPase
METFNWPSVAEFVGRETEREELEGWWNSSERMPVSLYGRRRGGKSWLLRRFAHGKPAVVLVARRMAPGAQFDDLADRLEPILGVRPSITSLSEFFTIIYHAAQKQKMLVVIDEFPYLLPTTEVEIDRELTAIASVMENERDVSNLKLILCGSLVSQMESLLAERSPLYGRLRPLQLQPITFQEARLHLPGLGAIDQFERYALAGGMPRYLSTFTGPDMVADIIKERILNPNAALWDEGRAVLEQELREPKIYFTILQELASGDKDSGELTTALRSDAQRTSKYLRVLEDMRLVERRLPMGSVSGSRAGHWHLRDPFLRFWFRFVFPFQDDLESGLTADALFAAEVEPDLHDHIGRQFEDFCLSWTRANQPVTKVGAWWGPSLNSLRAKGVRSSEEIDIVGVARNRITLIGEARWGNSAMSASYLDEIQSYKLPALKQSGLKMIVQPKILLFSRGGYTKGLQTEADGRSDLELIDVSQALSS